MAGHCQVDCAMGARAAADRSSADSVKPRPPRSKSRRACAQLSLVLSPEPVPTDGKEIPDDTVHRQEALSLWARLETPHGALALSRRLMGDFGQVVGVAPGIVEPDGMTARCAAR